MGVPGWFDAAVGAFLLVGVVAWVIADRFSPGPRASWLHWLSAIGTTAAGIGFLLWSRSGPLGSGRRLAWVGLMVSVVAGLAGDIVMARRTRQP